MEAMRQSWTDDRLDDLSARMDHRFDRVEGDIRELRAELAATRKELKAEIAGARDSLQGEIAAAKDSLQGEIAATRESLHSEFHALQRTMLIVAGGLIAASLGFMVTIVGVITQL